MEALSTHNFSFRRPNQNQFTIILQLTHDNLCIVRAMNLRQRLMAITSLFREMNGTTLMKDLLLCTLLMQAPVLAQADSTDNQFQLQFPKKDHLTAQQLYDVTDRTGFAKEIGQFVVLDVVVKIARDVPLVEIEKPAALAAGSKIEVLNASVISATTAASSWKTGDRLRIEGIVVGEGYSCYTIYLLNHKESKRPANAVAEPALESDKPSAEDLALVKSFIVTGTVKQAIGSFNGEGNHLDPGASFEFDLSNLPKEKIQFTRPHPQSPRTAQLRRLHSV